MLWRKSLVGLCLLLCSATLTFGQTGGVTPSLLKKLNHGVNVTRWFCYQQNVHDSAHFAKYLNDQDFKAFKDLKLGFVRLCISPDVIYRDGKPDAVNLVAIDKAIELLRTKGLVVIWDLHDNGQLKVDEAGKNNDGFVEFWSEIASHYKHKFEDGVLFELLNEPVFRSNPQDWFSLQKRTVEAIRSADPRRTIMVSGTSWSGIDDLAKLPLLPEKNLVYTFHCYDPFWFTHQGASWVGDPPQGLKQVPFPATPDAVAKVIDLQSDKDKSTLESYGKQGFDANYLDARLQLAMQFASRYHVPLVLGEFGSYPLNANPADRARWFDAMRIAIDKNHVPNAIWGYDDGLGLGRSVDEKGSVKLDPVTLSHFYRVN